MNSESEIKKEVGLCMTFLSVIIPTRNRAKSLANTLASLTKQTYSTDWYEVLVIDNGSTDNTRDVCTTFRDKIPQLRYVYEEKPGLHVGRHLGMKMAQSDILVYADDDIEAFPTWLETIAENFKNPEVVLVGGKDLPKFESEPPQWIQKLWEKDNHDNRYLGYLSIIDLGEVRKEINPSHVFGCNFSIRKSILLEAGGFHPDAMPEDMIRFRGDGESHISRFIENKRYKTVYHPKASVYHNVPKDRLTEEYFCKRAYLQGISDSYTKIRNDVQNRLFTAYHLIWFLRLHRKKWQLYLNMKRRLFENSYYKGYSMHQNASRKDKTLYEWIIRTHYMDG
jgi:glycosyltransferase involved in cell wall biosynthesis